jgi:microcystin degradation protein MlrC
VTYRVAIGGISTESSTFAPHRTTIDEFFIQRGPEEMADRYPFLDNWRLPEHPDIEWIPLLKASALPGGQVLPDAYDTMEKDLLERLQATLADGPLDGFYFDIHGAMSIQGRRDAEARLAGKIRALVGDDCLISASMDLHGQVSEELARNVQLITAYRTAPHIDYVETRERAVRNLARCLTENIRPVRAWIKVPVMLPGEKTSTRVEPAQSIYASLPESEAMDGVIDASLLVGYAWADEHRSAATVIVYGTDEAVVTREAERIAQAWWDVREQFEFCAPSGQADWAIQQAFDSTERPFFISDSGDNPTAGGSNDVAFLLGRFLATPELASGERSAIWASCVAPSAVETAFQAGTGAQVTVSVGGVYGGGDPVELTGEVYALHTETRMGAEVRVAVVKSGGVHAILTSRRRPYHFVKDLLALGLDPAEHDITAVKIGYLQPDLFAAAKGWVMALTPGGVDQDLERLEYHEVDRPIHPLDKEIHHPDLTPVVFR